MAPRRSRNRMYTQEYGAIVLQMMHIVNHHTLCVHYRYKQNSLQTYGKKLIAVNIFYFAVIIMAENIREFHHDCLRAHNEYRQKHGARPLALSEELCQSAQVGQ